MTIAHCECQKKFYIIFFLWKTHKPCLDQYRIYFFAFKRAILFPKAHYPLHAKLGNLRNGMNKYQVQRNVLENVSTITRVFCLPVMNGNTQNCNLCCWRRSSFQGKKISLSFISCFFENVHICIKKLAHLHSNKSFNVYHMSNRHLYTLHFLNSFYSLMS